MPSRADLVGRLMKARRAVRGAKKAADPEAEATAHQAVDEVKQALGERGCGGTTARQISTGTWRENTLYAEWYAKLARSNQGGP